MHGQCGNGLQHVLYIPTAFTPDNDGLNDALKSQDAKSDCLRFGSTTDGVNWCTPAQISTNLDWRCHGGSHYAPDGVYHWVIKAAGFDTDAQEFRGFAPLR